MADSNPASDSKLRFRGESGTYHDYLLTTDEVIKIRIVNMLWLVVLADAIEISILLFSINVGLLAIPFVVFTTFYSFKVFSRLKRKETSDLPFSQIIRKHVVEKRWRWEEFSKGQFKRGYLILLVKDKLAVRVKCKESVLDELKSFLKSELGDKLE